MVTNVIIVSINLQTLKVVQISYKLTYNVTIL